MTDTRKVVKIFLASPGDLSEERLAAKLVVDEFNHLYAEEFGYQAELIGWEDTVSVYGRPQAVINRELERCELFLGMMWKKWGTPPDNIGKYSSGFEEEFEISVQRRLKTGRPEISLLFKGIDQEFLRDPGDDLKKVLAFKDKLIANKTIFFESFGDIREFETKIRRCISQYIIALKTKEVNEASLQNQAPTTSVDKLQSKGKKLLSETPLSIEGTKFLHEFISKNERNTENETLQAEEVSRFRLLSNIVGNSRNDVGSLGVHDANLLFTDGGHFNFGRRELNGLLSSGFEHYSHQNAPLWRWFAAIEGFKSDILPSYSVIGSSIERKVGALEAMRLISEPLPNGPQENREFYLNCWFSDESPSAVKIAALNYLGDFGITADLPVIYDEMNKDDYQTNAAAADAIIRINLRNSREKAIFSLYELQPTIISKKVLATIFDNVDALGTETLLNGVGHRNVDVRRIVAELLNKRRALPSQTAEQLLNDDDAKVRYEALKSLAENGRVFSDDESRNILIKPTHSKGLGLLGAASSGFSGDVYWFQFRKDCLRSLTNKKLEEVAAASSMFNREPQFILIERNFKHKSEELRTSIDGQFKDEFNMGLKLMTERFGDDFDEFKSLEEPIRKKLTLRGLEIICRQGEISDLGRVRRVLASGFLDYYSADAIEYLRKFGEWEDIPLIIESVKRPTSESTNWILLPSDEEKYKSAARAIYELGRTRIAEVLRVPGPYKLLVQIIKEIPDKGYRNLNDLSLNQLLHSEDDTARKFAAIKCIKALPKKRIVKLLEDYITNGQSYYYNVVHWLDFGVSTPRDRALQAADKILNKDL
jgi:hypothetical protein